MARVGPADTAGPFRHPALLYRDVDDYLAGTMPFITSGLAGDEPVTVVVPGDRLALLRAELGRDADRVRLLDMIEVGRNPGRIIAGVLRAFADRFPGSHVRIVGEPVWPRRSDLEYPVCAQHEALINYAFAGRRATILCPYDAAGLPAHVLADAARTHPVVTGRASASYPPDYAPDAVLADYNRPLARPVDAVELPVTAANLPDTRHTVADFGRQHGLAARGVADLMLASTELITNSIEHAHGAATVTLGTDAGMLICQVRDTGHIADVLAGRRPAPLDRPGGRGLLLVNELADLVRVSTTPAGTTVEVRFRVPPA